MFHIIAKSLYNARRGVDLLALKWVHVFRPGQFSDNRTTQHHSFEQHFKQDATCKSTVVAAGCFHMFGAKLTFVFYVPGNSHLLGSIKIPYTRFVQRISHTI